MIVGTTAAIFKGFLVIKMNNEKLKPFSIDNKGAEFLSFLG
jgi:hypothetical protein